MSLFSEWKSEWISKEPDSFSKHDDRQLRDLLNEVKDDELKNINDHKDYITVLSLYRHAIDTDEFRGKKYKDTIRSLLSQGEDGIYAGESRFLYELIQNADDCKYRNESDCHLDICFNIDKGCIIFSYNEVGFSPRDVFAITGIAEESKNTIDGNIQIGEKGIGFKSVFGVTDEVQIQSGMFSFKLKSEDFSIPIPHYQDNFKGVIGTRITLFMSRERVSEYYEKFEKRYGKADSILSENPIMFLNKLTKLSLIKSENGNHNRLTFESDKKLLSSSETVNVYDYLVSVTSSNSFAYDREAKFCVDCWRFEKKINFDQEMICSRYGKDTKLKTPREMTISAVFPKEHYIINHPEEQGLLYSFLPTQVRFCMPVYCHVPFKLAGSREYVDPQKDVNGQNSAWFIQCCKELGELLKSSYDELSRRVQDGAIVYYLPKQSASSLIAKTNAKISCLRNEYLETYMIREKKLLLCCDGTYQKIDDCLVIEHSQPEEAFALMQTDKHLFQLPDNKYTYWKERLGFEVKSHSDLVKELFKQALVGERKQEETLSFLDNDPDIGKDLSESYFRNRWVNDPINNIQNIAAYRNVWEVIKDRSVQFAKNTKFIFSISKVPIKLPDVRDGFFANEKISEEEFDRNSKAILQRVRFRYVEVEIPAEEFLIAGNAIVLSKSDSYASFCKLCSTFDPDGSFALRMQLRRKYIAFDKMCSDKNVTDREYLTELINLRKNVKDTLGDKPYRNYVSLIQQTGIDSSRFINELLQNADDLTYPDGVAPEFRIEETNEGICSFSNEIGFTRANIRAITAIGDSTKKKIENGMLHDFTGEKGIGFKVVFAKFSKVEIDSGSFHFYLTDSEPTIPFLSGKEQGTSGTVMRFTKKDTIKLPCEQELLQLCLTLKQLRKINIGQNEILINDRNNLRSIKLNGKEYIFEKRAHEFIINDAKALEERRDNQFRIDENQRLFLYIPTKDTDCPWYLYNGLPTAVKSAAPLAIDAPYMLNTSREDVLKNTWNSLVTDEVCKAIVQLIEDKVKVRSIGIEALKYLKVSNNEMKLFENTSSTSLCPQNFRQYLQNASIIPTKQTGFIVKPSDANIYHIPPVLHAFVEAGGKLPYGLSQIVDDKEKTEYKKILEYLGLKEPDANDICSKLIVVNDHILENAQFRDKLYSWLEKVYDKCDFHIRSMPVIPVLKRKDCPTKYISIKNAGDDLYVSKNEMESGDDYWILDEGILSYERLNKTFKKTCIEMDEEARLNRYIKHLETLLKQDPSQLYQCYLRDKDYWQKNRKDINFKYKAKFRKQNESYGTYNNAYQCDNYQVKGPFIRHFAINPEWNEYAEYFGVRKLSGIKSEDASSFGEILTDDDVFAIYKSGYFTDAKELIGTFIKNHQVPDELIKKYDLGLLQESIEEEIDEKELGNREYAFPKEKSGEAEWQLQQAEALLKAPLIVSEATTQKSVYTYINNGNTVALSYSGKEDEFNADVSDHLRKAYTPYKSKKCFCQMCNGVFYSEYLSCTELVHIAGEYYPQLYVVLCNRCKRKLDDQKKIAGYCQAIYDSFVNGEDEEADGKVKVTLSKTNLDPISFLPSHYQAVKLIVGEKWNSLSLSYNVKDHQAVKKAVAAPALRVGDCLKFGSYHSTATDITSLEWQVVKINSKNDEICLITTYGIDSVPFTKDPMQRDWEKSYIRKWLNDDFLRAAFTEEEKELLIKDDLSDYVRLLTSQEAREILKSDEDRKLLPTAYALDRGATTKDGSKNGEKTCWWWLKDKHGVSRHGIIKSFRYAYWQNSGGGYSGTEPNSSVRPYIVVKGYNTQFVRQQEHILGYLKNRGVTELIHFTPAENLKSILKNGLVPRDQADRLGGKCTDSQRIDGHTDTISLSISMPNDWMRKNKIEQGYQLVDLHIDIQALLTVSPDCLGFYPKNAASGEYNRDSFYTGIDNLKGMFKDTVEDSIYGNQTRADKQSNQPTHPQAEVLFRGKIPPEYIKKISTRGVSVDQSVIDECMKMGISLK